MMISPRIAILGLLTLSAVVRAEPGKPLAAWLPADTFAYVETNAPTAAEMARAVQYRCLQEPELKRALDRMLAEENNFAQMAVPVGDAVLRVSTDMREPGLSFALRYEKGRTTHTMSVRGNMAFAWVGVRPGRGNRPRATTSSPRSRSRAIRRTRSSSSRRCWRASTRGHGWPKAFS